MTRGLDAQPHARGRSAGISGSPLVRLLARLAEVDSPAPRQGAAEQLSHWLGWTDAISLSAALGSAAPPPATARSAPAGDPQADAARLRAQLARSLGDDGGTAPAGPRGRGRPMPAPPAVGPGAPADFKPHRRRYHARQQAMDAAIGPLRARLRGALAGRSAALGRLAAVDAVMEQALGERERHLLSVVPVLLEKRFEALRHAQASAPADAWRATFAHDMHRLLLAELDHRWLPIDGLLAALRGGPLPNSPAP